MPYFERTIKFANRLFLSSVIFFIIAAIVFVKGSVLDQVFEYSNGNYVSSGIYFTIFILLSVFTFILGMALKCVAKDAKEEFTNLKQELKNNKVM